MKLGLVPPARVVEVWPDAGPMLSTAILLSGGRYSDETTKAACESGDLQLWLARDDDGTAFAALVTAVMVYPARKMLAAVHAGGSGIERLPEPLALVEEWARLQGCDGVEIFTTRPGWALALPGYEKAGYLIERNFV